MKECSLCLLGVLLISSIAQGENFGTELPLTVNRTNRADVVNLFQTIYRASEGVPVGWHGNWETCDAGATSQEYIDATILRLNFFRVMAGLPGNVTSSNVWNAKCQQAALMMGRRGEVSHTPTPDWACYTADGAEAAGKSLLSFLEGPAAVAGYMDDFGAANAAVLHRRRLLYPPLTIVGTGTVPPCNALWTGERSRNDPMGGQEWVAWPPAGYVPWQLLPQVSGRWSFTYSGEATLADATVTMTCSGTNVPVVIDHRDRIYGRDMSIVWIPNGVPLAAPESDTTYSITISNVLVDLTYQSFTYEVTVIDPVPTEITFANRGAWPGSPRNYSPRHIQVVETTAFVADGPGGLRILNVSDPSAPTLIGGFATGGGYASDVQVVDQHAYVTDGARGLLIADVSIPASPALVAVLNTSGFAEAVHVVGKHAFIANGASGLAIIDVSSPANPRLVGNYTTAGYCRALDAVSNTVYLIVDDGTLEIVDVSDPSQPKRIGRFAAAGRVESVRASGQHVYLTDSASGLRILNVSNPSNPLHVRDFSVGGAALGVQFLGNYLFVSGASGLQVLDIVNPVRPLLKGVYRTTGSSRVIEVHGDYVYLPDGQGGIRIVQLTHGLLQTIEFDLPTELTITTDPIPLRAKSSSGLPVSFSVLSGSASIIGNALTFTAPGRVTIRAEQAGDDHFLPASVTRTVTVHRASQSIDWLVPSGNILRLATPSPLQAVTSSGLPVTFHVETGPAVIKETNVIATGQGTIRIAAEQVGSVNFEPAKLTRTFNVPHVLFTERGAATFDADDRAQSIHVQGAYAYVALGSGGLRIVDISDPAAPRLAGRFVSDDSVKALRVAGDRAFVAGSSTLLLLDIGDPSNVLKIAEATIGEGVLGLHVTGNVVFVASGAAGLKIFAVEETLTLKLLSTLKLTGPAVDVWFDGNNAYVAVGPAGLDIVDARQPDTPRFLANLNVGGSMASVQSSGNLAYLAGDDGLHIVDIRDPAQPTELSVYRATGAMESVQFLGNLAYVANDRTGFQVIDVSDPAGPTRIGSNTTRTVGFDVFESFAVVATDRGIQILELSLRVPQVIEFPLPPNATLDDSPISLAATANSGLPVTFQVLSGDATIEGDELLLHGPGLVTVRAEQPGDSQFLRVHLDRLLEVTRSTPPRIGSLSYLPTGDIYVQVKAAPKQDLVLEFSIDLKSWTPVAVTVATSNSAEFRLSSPLFIRRGFYRIRVL